MSKPLKLTNDECQDIWSALSVWQRELDKKNNPITNKAITKLIKKIRKHIASYP